MEFACYMCGQPFREEGQGNTGLQHEITREWTHSQAVMAARAIILLCSKACTDVEWYVLVHYRRQRTTHGIGYYCLELLYTILHNREDSV